VKSPTRIVAPPSAPKSITSPRATQEQRARRREQRKARTDERVSNDPPIAPVLPKLKWSSFEAPFDPTKKPETIMYGNKNFNKISDRNWKRIGEGTDDDSTISIQTGPFGGDYAVITNKPKTGFFSVIPMDTKEIEMSDIKTQKDEITYDGQKFVKVHEHHPTTTVYTSNGDLLVYDLGDHRIYKNKGNSFEVVSTSE
jgi:hypothetical protein